MGPTSPVKTQWYASQRGEGPRRAVDQTGGRIGGIVGMLGPGR